MSAYETKVNQSKVDAVTEIKDSFSEVSDFVFTDYRGLTVEQITGLRRKLAEMGAEYHVVKNTHARIAFKDMEHPEVADLLVGPTALAFVKEDSNAVTKALFDFAKEAPVSVKGGLVDGTLYDAGQMEAYSKLPGRDQLIAMLMSTMNAPVQNFVFAINGVVTKLVRTLQAVADSKSEA